MSDKEKDETKGSEADRDEDERDERDEQDDEDEDREEGDKGDESDESDESEAEARGAKKADADDDGERDEAAARVAEALGLEGEGDAKDAAEASEAVDAAEEKPAAPPNRAERRRQEALERRRKRAGKAKPADDAEVPKDRNKRERAKQLLEKRKEAASQTRGPSQLDTGEMVDDVLSRTWAATTKWVRGHLGAVQGVVAAAIVVGAGYVGYNYYVDKTRGAASGLLFAAVQDGYVMPEDKRDDDTKEVDPFPVWKSMDDRRAEAKTALDKVMSEHGGSGAALLAKLAKAGLSLEQRDYDGAIAGYTDVLGSALAKADTDVRARAIEGQGLAKEGKKDVEGALASFKELSMIDGYKELGQYHQARLLAAKGTEDDKAKAIDLLKQAYEAVKKPSLDGKRPSQYLEKAIEQSLKTLDPKAVPDRGGMDLGGMRGTTKSREEIDAMIREMQERAKKKAEEHQDGDGH